MRHGRTARTLVAVVAVGAGLAGAQPVAAAEICVGGPGPGCLASIQDAVDAAGDGDTIRIGSGTYGGGITITKSVSLVGAGAGATRIVGGGPVITIGSFVGPGGPAQPTVSISRVTITGGLVRSQGVAAGGGVSIPFAGPDVQAAAVTISDSVVTRNRVSPSGLFPAGGFCGPTPCAVAWGGGIDSSGTLTIVDTIVSDNVAGSTPADGSAATIAEGGGIRSHPGATLSIDHSVVRGNRAATVRPNGRFAFGGGIGDDGVLTVEDSAIDGNSVEVVASVPSAFPFDIQQEAGGGGLFSNGSATIVRTTVSRNTVSASNAGGDAQAVSGGVDADGSLLVVDSSIDHNVVEADVPAVSGFLAGAVFGGLQVEGTATVRDSRIVGNSLRAVASGGTANVAGAGVANLSGRLTLERTVVTANRGTASGVGGIALGGGILNIAFGGGAPQLSVASSVVTANSVTAAAGTTPHGGGIFSADIFSLDPVPFTLDRTVVQGNSPDQCVGC